jgi:hypothetical protein
MEQKKILYFDMDNVIVDFQSGIDNLSDAIKKEYEARLDEVPNIFSYMKPVQAVQGAVEAVKLLAKYFDAYILSTCPWKNITGASQKIEWVKKYFGFDGENVFYKRVILSHHKNLNKGDYLIDDRTKNGADKFEGELIQFGSEKFPNWEAVTKYLFEKENIYSVTLKEKHDEFMDMFNKLSPRDKCKFTGDDPHDFYTPEEEAAFQIEISKGSERLKERETFKKLDAIIAAQQGNAP